MQDNFRNKERKAGLRTLFWRESSLLFVEMMKIKGQCEHILHLDKKYLT
ncbi:hypothetical protein KNP414_06748 [Paenibacillus mucilaginosus KNP414]|uniref:Uncharacterized protein n=1 Tax=Paenibacillus mucilaginosus (strain KNP414) TaxID=1036673 RepID=F8FCE8_PAEMK|nr:hypothetical protein KNP414_06748 [Paenibacillus mucilaginosus KNP414]